MGMTDYPEVGNQGFGSHSKIICDGEVTVTREHFVPRPGVDDGNEVLTIHVKIGHVIVQTFIVEADKIEHDKLNIVNK